MFWVPVDPQNIVEKGCYRPAVTGYGPDATGYRPAVTCYI